MKASSQKTKINTVMIHLLKIKSLGLFLLILLNITVSAQSGPLVSSLPDSVIEQRLVDLALKGPEFQKVEHQNKVFQYQLKSARNSWMNFLTLSANYNDQSLLNPNAAYVYPKYFFGLNIPLGTIISGKQTKIAKEGVAIGVLTAEETKRKIKADVVGKYRQYKAQGELLLIETGYMNDLQAQLTQAENNFRKGTITFDDYNKALKNRNDEQARIINLKLQQDLTKLEIEKMIGTNLESVVK